MNGHQEEIALPILPYGNPVGNHIVALWQEGKEMGIRRPARETQQRLEHKTLDERFLVSSERVWDVRHLRRRRCGVSHSFCLPKAAVVGASTIRAADFTLGTAVAALADFGEVGLRQNRFI